MKEGTFINHDLSQKNKKIKFNDVSIHVNDVLIDSSTQFDTDRFLFAKSVLLSTSGYTFPTPDSLYFFKAQNISVSGEKHTLTALNVQLEPRQSREQFKKKLTYQKERYDIKIPRLTLTGVDWYGLVNQEKLFAKDVNIYEPEFDIYFDRSLPVSPEVEMQNFPSQLIMKLPFPILFNKVNVHHLDLIYGEFNPVISKSGAIYFDDINCTINNITNVPEKIRQNKFMTLKADALFMHKVPTTIHIQFDLAGYKGGLFTADIKMATIDSQTTNQVAVPLGGFSLKTGIMKEASAHISGDNYNATTRSVILYNDLKLNPLKKDPGSPGSLKKKTVTGIIANTFLIKNDNPSKGEAARIAEVSHKRKVNTSFFSLLWKTILTGILKTIGLPVKLADK